MIPKDPISKIYWEIIKIVIQRPQYPYKSKNNVIIIV